VNFLAGQFGYFTVSCRIYADYTSQAWVYLTQDGGQSWVPSLLPAAPGPVHFATPSTGWQIAGGKLYRSENGGKNWTALKNVTWSGEMSFIDAKIGWIAAKKEDQYGLVMTLDGGSTLTEILPVAANK
jgi:hypothetical protein